MRTLQWQALAAPLAFVRASRHSSLATKTACGLRQAISNPSLVSQAVSAGFTCQLTSSGDGILRYWDFSVDARQAAGILLGFYFTMHLASYLTLSRMYRQKR